MNINLVKVTMEDMRKTDIMERILDCNGEHFYCMVPTKEEEEKTLVGELDNCIHNRVMWVKTKEEEKKLTELWARRFHRRLK